MKNTFADVIEKKSDPRAWSPLYLLRTLVCDILNDTLAARVLFQFYRLLNYNVDNLIEWRLRVTRYDIAINNMCVFSHNN